MTIILFNILSVQMLKLKPTIPLIWKVELKRIQRDHCWTYMVCITTVVLLIYTIMKLSHTCICSSCNCRRVLTSICIVDIYNQISSERKLFPFHNIVCVNTYICLLNRKKISYMGELKSGHWTLLNVHNIFNTYIVIFYCVIVTY